MAKDFIPAADADLLIWAQGNSALITATPTAFFLSVLIASTYADLVSDFATKLAAARGENRGRVDTIAKDESRDALVSYARSWARLFQGQMAATTTQRAQLGLNLRDDSRTPINPPVESPVVTVVQALGHTLRLKVRAADSAGRAKAKGAQGATIFTFLGSSPSPLPSEWTCQGQATRGNFDLQMGPEVPAGSQVWISAVWYSPRGEYTEMSNPISAFIAGGIAAAGEASNAELTPAATPALKAA